MQIFTPISNRGVLPPFLYPFQHELSLVFLILLILEGVKWNLGVIFIYISLMTNDVKHFFKCFLKLLRFLC